MEKLARELGVSINAVSLAYLCSRKDFLTIPIIGCSSHEQLLDSMSAVDVEFDNLLP